MSEQQQEYGGIIINGIDCSGGDGSSVTPNPPAPATETLSSLDINGVVYGIEQETRENIFSIFDTINVNSDCSSGTLTSNAYVFGINDARNDWSGSTTIYNNDAYDLSDIDTLELVVDITQQSDYAYLWVTFSPTKYTWGSSSWPGVYQNVDSAIQVRQSGSYEIDVSELTGSYYIYIGATSGKDSIVKGDCNNIHNGVISGTVTAFNIISTSSGTEVIPNPSGTATDTLNKIEIDGVIYDLPSGGEGGGGFDATTLYEATSYSDNITLDDNYTNYDYLLFTGYATAGTGYLQSNLYKVEDLLVNNNIGVADDGNYSWWKITSETTLVNNGSVGTYYVKKIYGLKASGGSSGGSAYTETVLWSDSTGVNADPTDPQTITLLDNLSNYDFIYVDTTPDKLYDIINHNNMIIPVSSIDTTGTNSIALNCLGQDIDYIPILFYNDDTHLILSSYNTSGEYPITYWKIVGIKIDGGGSEIEPNSEEEPTETLENIKIDDTVYSVGGGNVDDVYVNGDSVLDANKIAQVKTHKEVSLAEYEDVNDDIIYFVDDDDDELGIYYSPIIYSTEEREVGTWTDGKPLYQKTVVLNSISVGENLYTLDFVNVDTIVSKDFSCIREPQGSTKDYIIDESILELWDEGSVVPQIWRVNTNNVQVSLYSGYYTPTNISITLKYTKTTDTPGSAKYNALGVPMTHYSTDEQVIGTWIDGKPIYRRTWEFSTYVTVESNAWADTNIVVANEHIKIITSCDAISDAGAKWNFISATTDLATTTYVRLLNTRTNSGVRVKYLTLEYTKTTD